MSTTGTEAGSGGGWDIWIPADLIRRSAEVGDPAFRLFCVLKTYADDKGDCWPGLQRLADATNMSIRNVKRAIRKLKTKGWIGVQKRSQQTNLYTIIGDSKGDKSGPSQTPEGPNSVSLRGQIRSFRGDKSGHRTISRELSPENKREAADAAHTHNGGSDKTKRFKPPDVAEVAAYCQERRNGIDARGFVDYYTAKGWLVGKSPMKDWRAAVRTWESRQINHNGNGQSPPSAPAYRTDEARFEMIARVAYREKHRADIPPDKLPGAVRYVANLWAWSQNHPEVIHVPSIGFIAEHFSEVDAAYRRSQAQGAKA